MSRRGTNPCLVCAEPAAGPKGGVVCVECRRKVEDYDVMRARFLDGSVCIRLSQYPYVPGRGRESPKRQQLDDLLRELRSSLDRPTNRRGWACWPAPGELANEFEGKARERGVIEGRDFMPYNVDARLAQFLIDLEPMLQQALREAEEDGKRQGSNLLAQLAAGNLTTDEFHKKAGIVQGGA